MTERKTKKDVVVSELRQRIETGALRRGDWIRQDVLAEELSTSITPVREAMRELQAEGLLVGHPHRGVQVATIDIDQVKGVYMCRRLVEPYAMQRAAYAVSRRDLDEARRLNEAMAQASRDGDGLLASELNRDMHFIFYGKSGPDSFVEIITDLWAAFPWDLLRLLEDRVSSSVEEHKAMIDAVERNDVTAIRRTTEDHIMHGYRDLAAYLDDGGDGMQRTGRAELDDPFEIDHARSLPEES